jgi:uncharacterized membrane protein YccC
MLRGRHGIGWAIVAWAALIVAIFAAVIIGVGLAAILPKPV